MIEVVWVVKEVIPEILSVLWFLLIIALLVVFYRPIRDDLIPRLTGFQTMGVEFSFVRESIDSAVELAEKSPQWKVEVSEKDKERVLNRAKQHFNLFSNAQILWVDDFPQNNRSERKMFRQLGARIDIAKSTDEALENLGNDDYDFVISDMARGSNPTEGLECLKTMRQTNYLTPVVFYIGVYDSDKGIPSGAFGITNRPDELLHLALDVLGRKHS